jgi:hypothetical protein
MQLYLLLSGAFAFDLAYRQFFFIARAPLTALALATSSRVGN